MTNIEFIKNQSNQEADSNTIFVRIATGDKFVCATITNDERIRLYSVADDTGKSDIYVSEDVFNKEFKRV